MPTRGGDEAGYVQPGELPPEPDPEGGGLHIRLSRITNLTEKGLLPHPFFFQCPPLEAFTRSFQFSHSDYDSLRSGQFSRPGSMQLRSWTFNTLFVDYGAPFTLYEKLPPNYENDGQFQTNPPGLLGMTDQLESLLESGTPFYLYVANLTARSRAEFKQGKMMATLRTLEVEERAGETDARYANVNFVEFRRPSIITQRKGKGAKLPVSVLVRTLPAKRDTLYELAKFYYGSASKWRLIHKANSLHVAPSLNLKKHFAAQRNKKLRIPKPS